MPLTICAQNDLQFSHIMFNEVMYNPATTGNSQKLYAALVARQQWTGMDQAPSSQFLNAHAFFDKVKGGVGLMVINDRLGFENTLNLKLNYAYHARLTDKLMFSAGIGAGFINKSLNGTALIYEETNDPSATKERTSAFVPDFNAGVEVSSEKFNFGIASSHVSQGISEATNFKVPRHYFLHGKYNWTLNEDLTIIPSLLVKSSGFIHQYEVNSNVLYQKKYWAGLTYRLNESVVGLVGLHITPNLRLGYSYDYNARPVNSFTRGSHEIMLQGVFNGFSKKKYNYKSTRFF